MSMVMMMMMMAYRL